jgi:hypothetical protein
MTPGQLLFQLLSQTPETAALLGTRIRPNRLEAGTQLPAAVYQLVNNQPERLMHCALPDTARVQVVIYGTSYAQMEAVALAVRKALDGYRTADGTDIEYDSEGDQYDEDARVGGRRQDYLITTSQPL